MKSGSRRTGGLGVDLTELTGVLYLNGASDPTALSFATQAEAEAGVDTDAVMTPNRVRQAINSLGSASAVSIPFAYGDATPSLIGEVPAGKTVESVRITITTAFNGTGAALSVGISGDSTGLMATSANDPTTIASYETHPSVKYVSATNIYLSITPGAGATLGAGVAVVTFR